MNVRKIIIYIACSINGKIARPDGDVGWLESIPNPDGLDYGYAEFYESVDTTIQGHNTYRQLMSWGIDFPYKEKKNYVITSNKKLVNTEFVEFITENHIGRISKLKKSEGGNIWLVGGGRVNSLLLEAGLIDEARIFVMPVIIPAGIDLFEGSSADKHLDLVGTEVFPTGVTELRYKIK